MKKIICILLILSWNTAYAYNTKKYAENGLIPLIPEIKLDLNKTIQLKPDLKYIPPGDYPKEYILHQSPMYHPPLFQIWERY